MIADYIDSLTTHGAAFYRNLFWEAGMVGQVLYLEPKRRVFARLGSAATLTIPSTRSLGSPHESAELLSLHRGWPTRGHTAHTLPAYDFEEPT